LQSDVIKTRTNKAYDHIKELVDSGFLIKQKHGRSYMLKLSKKFFDYFDLKDKENIKERFKEFADINEEELKKTEQEKLEKEKLEQEQQKDKEEISKESQQKLDIDQEKQA
jgi:chromosome segregation and condensation protein ScpB